MGDNDNNSSNESTPATIPVNESLPEIAGFRIYRIRNNGFSVTWLPVKEYGLQRYQVQFRRADAAGPEEGGWKTVYSGKIRTVCTCGDLEKDTEYYTRMRYCQDNAYSKWSEELYVKTDICEHEWVCMGCGHNFCGKRLYVAQFWLYVFAGIVLGAAIGWEVLGASGVFVGALIFAFASYDLLGIYYPCCGYDMPYYHCCECKKETKYKKCKICDKQEY